MALKWMEDIRDWKSEGWKEKKKFGKLTLVSRQDRPTWNLEKSLPLVNYTYPIIIPLLHIIKGRNISTIPWKKVDDSFLSFVRMIISRCTSRNRSGIRWDQSYRLLDRFYHRFERENSQNLHRGYFNSIEIERRGDCKPLGYWPIVK